MGALTACLYKRRTILKITTAFRYAVWETLFSHPKWEEIKIKLSWCDNTNLPFYQAVASKQPSNKWQTLKITRKVLKPRAQMLGNITSRALCFQPSYTGCSMIQTSITWVRSSFSEGILTHLVWWLEWALSSEQCFNYFFLFLLFTEWTHALFTSCCYRLILKIEVLTFSLAFFIVHCCDLHNSLK